MDGSVKGASGENSSGNGANDSPAGGRTDDALDRGCAGIAERGSERVWDSDNRGSGGTDSEGSTEATVEGFDRIEGSTAATFGGSGV